VRLRSRQSELAALALLAWAAQAAAAPPPPPFTLRGSWQQGSLIFGRIDPRDRVSFNGRPLRISPTGDFVFGLDRDEPARAELQVVAAGMPSAIFHYAVAPHAWPLKRIEGLPPATVNPPPEAQARIEREQALIAAAHSVDSGLGGYLEHFVWPVHGPISVRFGSQRVLNGSPNHPHLGMDIAVPAGTPVVAPASGVVTLAEPDLFFTGGTVILDHGHGVFSVFAHLSRLNVKVGDRIARGALLADSGMTGRATGPHLHWGLYWFNAHVDPLQTIAQSSAAKH
jgi:hypothetical protein